MVVCHSCGEEYDGIGAHYAKSDCDHPEFTDRQTEIIEGMMLGDGWINHHNDRGNPFFAVGMTNYKFLSWLDSEMKPHTTGVKNATGSKKSTKPYYKVRTRRNPRLEEYSDWYSTGELKLKQIDLTPLSLKMWYVSDGHLHKSKDSVRPEMKIANKIVESRDKYFKKLFEPLGVSPRVGKNTISFTKGETEDLIEYMGDAPVGFDYKWPMGEEYRCDNCDKITVSQSKPKRCPYCMSWSDEYHAERAERAASDDAQDTL